MKVIRFAAVALAHLFVIRQEGWGAAGDKLSLQFVAANFRTNGWFYLGDPRFPALYTLLALAAKGELRTPAVLRAQAERLLKTPDRFTANFAAGRCRRAATAAAC